MCVCVCMFMHVYTYVCVCVFITCVCVCVCNSLATKVFIGKLLAVDDHNMVMKGGHGQMSYMTLITMSCNYYNSVCVCGVC